MRGGVFLGSNNSYFLNADTLAKINVMPHGLTDIICQSKKRYRFFRYQSARYSHSSLSELQIFENRSDTFIRQNGTYMAEGVDTVGLNYLYDNNTATLCRALNTGYNVTIDAGQGNLLRIDKIRYAPSTDLNFVEKGHLYELYYFDTQWVLIDRKIATEEWLSFNNVPRGALLLLKDKTAGHEERIFEYNNGRQLWY